MSVYEHEWKPDDVRVYRVHDDKVNITKRLNLSRKCEQHLEYGR